MRLWPLVFVLYLGALFLLRGDLAALLSGGDGNALRGALALVVLGMMLGHVVHLAVDLSHPSLRWGALALTAAAVLSVWQHRDTLLAAALNPAPVANVATADPGPPRARIPLAWDGHYRANATIGGHRLAMLVDTGATLVVLRYEDARRLRLLTDDMRFEDRLGTAGGATRVERTRLASISVGDVTATDIDAAIARPGLLEASLLGMSFLGFVDVSIRGEVMTLVSRH